MLVLALDTTTRQGSAAIAADDSILGTFCGDGDRTHGERLPGDLIRLLESTGVGLAQIDLYAVAAGPGSFTGLRIGIAAMQGLALTNGKKMVGVSALDALHRTVAASTPLVGVWMDAQRGEVFSALYRAGTAIDGPAVEEPRDCLARWRRLAESEPITLAGDGALAYVDVIREHMPGATMMAAVPALAPAIARMALEVSSRGRAIQPAEIRPIYVRRPDAELAKERKAGRTSAGR